MKGAMQRPCGGLQFVFRTGSCVLSQADSSGFMMVPGHCHREKIRVWNGECTQIQVLNTEKVETNLSLGVN